MFWFLWSALALAGSGWGTQFVERQTVAGFFDATTGEVDDLAFARHIKRGGEIKLYPERTEWWPADKKSKEALYALITYRDPGTGEVAAVRALTQGAFVLSTKSARIGSVATGTEVAVGQARWAEPGGRIWWATDHPGLFVGYGDALWVNDERAWSLIGGWDLAADLQDIRDAPQHLDPFASVEAIRRLGQVEPNYREALAKAILEEDLERLQGAIFQGDDAWIELRRALRFELCLHAIGADGRHPWAGARARIRTTATAAATRLISEERAAGRPASALLARALRDRLRQPSLAFQPMELEQPALGMGWADPERREADELILRAAAEVFPAPDPRVGFSQELLQLSPLGHLLVERDFGIVLGAAYGAWAGAQGQPLVRPQVTWSGTLHHESSQISDECLVRVQRNDDTKLRAWEAKVEEKARELQEAKKQQSGTRPELPLDGGGPGYGGSIERQYSRSWVEGDTLWTESGIETVARTAPPDMGGKPFRWRSELAADSWVRLEMELSTLLGNQPYGPTVVDEAHPASFDQIVDHWTGELLRVVDLGAFGRFESRVAVDETRVQVEGPLCVASRDDRVDEATLREQIALTEMDGAVVEAITGEIEARIQSVGTDWTAAQGAVERAALTRYFLPQPDEIVLNPVRSAWAAGISEDGRTMWLVDGQGIYPHDLRTGAPLSSMSWEPYWKRGYDDLPIADGAVSPDGRWLATRTHLGYQTVLAVRDLRTQRTAAQLQLSGILDFVFLDGDRLAVQRASGGRVGWSLWDLSSGAFEPMDGLPTFQLGEVQLTYDHVDFSQAPGHPWFDKRMLNLEARWPDGRTRTFYAVKGVSDRGLVLQAPSWRAVPTPVTLVRLTPDPEAR